MSEKILVGDQLVFNKKEVAAGASFVSDPISIDNNFDRMTVYSHSSALDGTLELEIPLNGSWYPALTDSIVSGSLSVFSNYHFFPKVRFKFTAGAGAGATVVSCQMNIVKHVAQ